MIRVRHLREKLEQLAPSKEAIALRRRVKKTCLKKNLNNEKNSKVCKFQISSFVTPEYTTQLESS